MTIEYPLLRLGAELRLAMKLMVQYMDLSEAFPLHTYFYGSILLFVSFRILDKGLIRFKAKRWRKLGNVIDREFLKRQHMALRLSNGRRFRRLAQQVNLVWDDILKQMENIEYCSNCEDGSLNGCTCTYFAINFSNLIEIATLIYNACIDSQYYYPPGCIMYIIETIDKCDSNDEWVSTINDIIYKLY